VVVVVVVVAAAAAAAAAVVRALIECVLHSLENVKLTTAGLF
jgi:hypothetical protein